LSFSRTMVEETRKGIFTLGGGIKKLWFVSFLTPTVVCTCTTPTIMPISHSAPRKSNQSRILIFCVYDWEEEPYLADNSWFRGAFSRIPGNFKMWNKILNLEQSFSLHSFCQNDLWLTLIPYEFILEAILNNKCHMNIGAIFNGYGAADVWNSRLNEPYVEDTGGSCIVKNIKHDQACKFWPTSGVTGHHIFSRNVTEHLIEQFPDRWIGRGGP
jgi:hypothetical protein